MANIQSYEKNITHFLNTKLTPQIFVWDNDGCKIRQNLFY